MGKPLSMLLHGNQKGKRTVSSSQKKKLNACYKTIITQKVHSLTTNASSKAVIKLCRA